MAKRKSSVREPGGRESSVARGSGNVFLDLGFEDAEELQLKAGLTRQIQRRINTLGLTQVAAGAKLGIGQPDVSKLMNGRYSGFSVDRLIALLTALAVDVTIVLHAHALKNGDCRRGAVRITEKRP